MAPSSYVTLDEIPTIRQTLHETFQSGITKPLEWRQHQLLQLASMVQENHAKFVAAVHADLGRPPTEIYAPEVQPLIDRTLICFRNLGKWMETEWKETTEDYGDHHFESWKPRVYHEPKGTVLIISPWNYPLILSLQPLMGAICAGCTALIKVSEIAPHYADVLVELLPKYLDNNAYKVVQGAVPEITAILQEKWDHIFYTGHGSVARIISAAAAKHLTPVTLELGGKNPVIIDPEYPDLKLAARRVFFGKMGNSGQFCVAPDYVLLSQESLQPFVDGLKEAINEFYPPKDSFEERWKDVPKLVSQLHFDRVSSLIANTKGKIIFGGDSSGKLISKNGAPVHKIAPTIVILHAAGWEEDSLMKGENFAPVLPIVVLPSSSPEEFMSKATDVIRSRDHPLVLYAFSERENVKENIRLKTLSGNLVFNDTTMQLAVNAIPFGGVGESGSGRQILRYTFEEFSYLRACVDIPRAAESALAPRYPPFPQEKTDFWVQMCGNTVIPPSPLANGVNGVNGHH